MSITVVSGQAALWVERCRQNIQNFRACRATMTAVEQIEFIRTQYAILHVLRNVAAGNAYLHGTQHPTPAPGPAGDGAPA